MLSFIEETVSSLSVSSDRDDIVFCDIFAGTSAVGKHFKALGYSVISNDIQHFSYILAKVLVEQNGPLEFRLLKKQGISDPLAYLNALRGTSGFIYRNYAPGGTKGKEYERMYFSDRNARRIDAIRSRIAQWKTKGYLTDKEYYFLVACLLEAADKVANTASVYEAFLKKIKPSAEKDLSLVPLEYTPGTGNHTYLALNGDGAELLEHIRGDILYMDPPYNTRKYDTNYHILETIALNDRPKIYGKTGVRAERCKKSDFCSKKEASRVLEDMVRKAKFEYILLSYNNEGIISAEEIERIFSRYGTYTCFQRDHKRYKSDNQRQYAADRTVEYLHCLKKAEIGGR